MKSGTFSAFICAHVTLTAIVRRPKTLISPPRHLSRSKHQLRHNYPKTWNIIGFNDVVKADTLYLLTQTKPRLLTQT